MFLNTTVSFCCSACTRSVSRTWKPGGREMALGTVAHISDFTAKGTESPEDGGQWGSQVSLCAADNWAPPCPPAWR
jgi:hypothetical protein